MGRTGKSTGHGSLPRSTSAFTLIELLVVIAITTILLGLLFGPIFQGFNITRRSQAIASSQDAARFSLETITRDLSQAAFVYDNTRSPVIMPIGTHGNRNFGNPAFLYARIDFIPSATESTDNTDPDLVVDPTTGGRLGGARLRFPAAPSGRRVVRYWVGLRRNVDENNQAMLYSNVYEFSRDNGTYNPFVLWRAEYDPRDPNLIDQNIEPGSPNEYVANAGGFNDPNFFYNVGKTGPNGSTFAQNWRNAASPVLSVDRVDLLAVNRNSDGTVADVNPLRTLVSFAPATVVGDAATPGYLTDTGNEIPNAVPSVYTARYGQWTLPFTITVYRHASRRNPTIIDTSDPGYDPLAGSLRVRVAAEPLPSNPGQSVLVVRVLGSTGSLATTQSLNTSDLSQQNTSDFAHAFGTRGVDLTQKTVFVKTRNLTFSIDPLRGRVQTGFPPLAADGSGVPLFDDGSGTPTVAPAYFQGDPIPLVFRRNTRSDLAGQQIPGAPQDTFFPINAGIRDADLNAPTYYFAGDFTTAYPSPFTAFNRGLMVPGSERVLGPDSNPLNAVTVPYHRLPAVSQLSKQSGNIEPVDPSNYPSNPATKFASFPAGPLEYRLELDLDPTQPRVIFDDAIAITPPPQGLPATLLGSSDPEKFVEITYLWQNNYARALTAPTKSGDPELGDPVDAEGRSVAGRAAAPEADVIKVDYSTRSLLNVSLGVRVYDANSGRPQTVQLSNKIKVNNAGR